MLERLRGIAPFTRVAHADRVAGQPLHGFADGLAADGAGHDGLHVGNVQPVARRVASVDVDIDVAPADKPFGQRRAYPRHLLGHGFHLLADTINLLQVGTGDLHPDGTLDAGGEHVDAVADWRNPDVGQPRHLHGAVQLLDQFLRGHPGTPLLARFETDGGLEHLQWRRIGGRLGAPGLAEHRLDLRHRAYHPVGLL